MKTFLPSRSMLIASFTLLFSLSIFAQSKSSQLIQQEKKYLKEKEKLEDLRFDWIKSELKKIGLPKTKDSKLKSNIEQVRHNAFILEYNETHEQANWVIHMILPQIFEICAERTEDFREDLTVKSKSATAVEYSGLSKNKTDRGHLAPAADLRWSTRAVSSSFYYSNMSPQASKLNQGRWADLEKFMRAYVQFYGDSPIVIVSGPVLKDLNTGKINTLNNIPNGVSIPKRYFKIAFDIKRERAIGFVMDQKTSKTKSWKSLIKSVDEIEEMTGIDFFSTLRTKKEDAIEKQKDLEIWDVFAKLKDTKPIAVSKLPKGVLNTSQLWSKAATLKGKSVKVMGKVIKSTLDSKGGVNLLLDNNKKPIRVRIKKEHLDKFMENLDSEFRGETIKVSGTADMSKFGKNIFVYVDIDDLKDIKVE